MKAEKLGALQEFREALAAFADSGWLIGTLIVVGVFFVLGAVASTLTLPLVLMRLHQRLNELERRLDVLAGRELPPPDRPG
jgi:hypothetical protein